MYSRSYSPGPALDSGLSSYRSYGGSGSSYGGHSGMAINPSLSRVMNTDYGLSDSLSSKREGPSYDSGRLSPLRPSPLTSSLLGDTSRHRDYSTISPTRVESRISSTIPASPTSRRKHVTETRWSPSSRLTNGEYFDFSSQALMSYTPPKSTYRRTDYSDYLHPLLKSRPVVQNDYTPRSRAEREMTTTPLTRERKLIKFRESGDMMTSIRRRISWVLPDDIDSSMTNESKEKNEETTTRRSRENSFTKPLSRGGSPRMSFKRFSREDSLTKIKHASQLDLSDTSRNTNHIFTHNRSPSPAGVPLGSPRSPRGQSRSRSRENSFTDLDNFPSPRNLSAALLSREKLRKNSLEDKSTRRKNSCDSFKSKDILSEIHANKVQGSGISSITERSLYDIKSEMATEISKSQFSDRLYTARKSIEDILPDLFEKSSSCSTENKESGRVGPRKLSEQLWPQNTAHAAPELINHSTMPRSRAQKRQSIAEEANVISNKMFAPYTSERRDSATNITELKTHTHRKSIKLKSADLPLAADTILHMPPSGPKTLKKGSKTELPLSEMSSPTSLDATKINSGFEKTPEPLLKDKFPHKGTQVNPIQMNQNQDKTKLNRSSFSTENEVPKAPKQTSEVNSAQKTSELFSQEKSKVLKDIERKEDPKINNIDLKPTTHKPPNTLASKYLNKSIEEKCAVSPISEVKHKDLIQNKADLKLTTVSRAAPLQTTENNLNKQSQINDHKVNDLKKPSHNLLQERKNSSNSTEPSLACLQTEVDKTKTLSKVVTVQQFSSKNVTSNLNLTSVSTTKSSEKPIEKDVKLSNSKYVASKFTTKQISIDSVVKGSEKTNSSDSKTITSPTTKDPVGKIFSKTESADLKQTVDPKTVSKPKDLKTVSQLEEKSKPVSTNTVPISRLESEEIVVVCKLPQPKWLKQTKDNNFLLPSYLTPSPGLKAPSVKQVAFQIRKETGTIIAEEIETTAHACIKIKETKINEITDKNADQQKPKPFSLKPLNDHRESDKVVALKKTSKIKEGLNLKCDMIKEEKEKSITPPTPKGLTQSPLINSNVLNQNKNDAINTQEKSISCNTQKNNISCEVQIPEVKKQNLETNVLLINKDLQKGQKLSSTLYNVKQVNVPKEKSEAASCVQDKGVEKPNLKTSSNVFPSDNSKQNVSYFKDNVSTHSVSKAVDTKAKSDIEVKNATKIEENFISNRKEKTSFSDDKGIKKVEAGAGIKISDQQPLAPIKDKALTITQTIAGIAEDTNEKQNKIIEKTDTKAAQSHALNSEMAKEKEVVFKTLKISDSKSKETETKTFRNEKSPEKSHNTAVDSKVKIESNLGLTDKSKEKFNIKEVEDVPAQVAKADFNKIIEPQKENFLKTNISVTTKLGVVPSKQKSIPFTEVPDVKNEDIKDKENCNLKIFSETDVHKKQEVSSKFSKISGFKDKEIETFTPKKPAMLGKSEIIAFDSKAKTGTKTENLQLLDNDQKTNENIAQRKGHKTDNEKSNAILSASDEKSSKSVVSVLSKPDNVSNKEKIIPTSKATEDVSNKQFEDKEKSNTKLIADANLQSILNKKETAAVSKVSKISDAKSKEIETVIPKKKEIETAIPKKVESDTVIPKKTEIDTVIPKKTKLDPVVPKKTEIDTVIPKKTETVIPKKKEIDTVIPKKKEIDTVIPKKKEIDTAIPKKTEIETITPKKTETVIPKKAEIETITPKKTETVIPKKKEIDTVVPKKAEIDTVIPKKTEIDTVILKKKEIGTVIPKKTEIETIAAKKTEIETVIPKKKEIDTVIPEKTEIETITPKKTETVIPKKTETVIPKKTETVIPKKTETVIPKKTETVIPEKTEINTVILKKTEIGTVIPKKTEIETVIPKKKEIETVIPKKKEIETVIPKKTEIETVIPKMTGIETIISKKKEMPKISEFKTPETKTDTNTESLRSDKKNEKYTEEPRELVKFALQKDVKNDLKTDKEVKSKEEKNSKSIVPSKPEIIPEEQKILRAPKITEDLTNKLIKDKEKSNLKLTAANEVQNSLSKKQDVATSKALKNVDIKINEAESLTSKYKTEYSLPSSDSKECKKDNFQLKKTDGQNKDIVQIASQPNEISKEKVGDSKINAVSNLQKQKAQEVVSPVLLKSKTLLDTAVAQPPSSGKNSNLKDSDAKITDKQTSESSKVNDSKVSDLSKGEKLTMLLKNTVSKAPEDLLPTLKVTSGKTNISDRKVEVNDESKVTSITGSNQATLTHPAAPKETALENHSLKTTKQSAEASNAGVVAPVDKKLVKQESPPLVPGVPKVTENLKQNTEKVVTLTSTKDGCLDKKLVPKPTLLESETEAKDVTNDKLKSKAGAETVCVNGMGPLIKDEIGKTNKSDTSVAQDVDKNVAKVIPANKGGLTSTLNIPEGGKQEKVYDAVEKSTKVSENENKDESKSSLTESNITQTKDILPEAVKKVNDAKPFMKSEEKEMPKVSRKFYGNEVGKTKENILTKETVKLDNEITDKESKSVPKGGTHPKDKGLTNGHVSSHTKKETKVEKIVPEYPEPKPSKLIGLFVQPKASAYKTIPESTVNSDESGTDSNDETLPINTNHRKSKGKSSEYDDRGRKRISSASSAVSTVTTCSNLSAGSEISNLSEDVRKSSLSSPQKTLKFRKYAIDDFQFLKLLGKGSFGKVLLAELKNSSVYFAVKCLKKDVVLEDDDVESTMIERRILALGTQHPYMCKLYCTFQTESHLCFVMEYLNGGDLMFHIQESGRFEQSRAMFYGAEVASALTFLHKRGIVYRDMKLDNVVLDEEGHIRLVDFGMCQCRISREECQPFNFCGTPQYIAPEIITGQKYNQSVDWWSFGVLLYEMLTGRSPFNGTDEDELFWSICNEEPHYPRFLTKETVNILQLFLNKNPDDRLGMPSCPEGTIRQQSFFSPIDWNKLEKKQVKPPFKPRVKYASDTSNFDSNFTMDVATLTPVEVDILRSMDQEQFKGFSYTNPHITG